ncbi:MAG TPA: monovalent cation/H(+) antiporter subunit G [Actinomycetes bacterium]|nr:monovalent cation/H(+) antiporter subunit G [Actinomycetes bacterium]
MNWASVADVASAICLISGATLALIAAVGALRFPDLLSRTHSATKPQVLGLLLVLLALAFRLRDTGSMGLLLLVALFQLITSPIASHMVGRAAFRSGEVREYLLVVDELSGVLPESSHRSGYQR